MTELLIGTRKGAWVYQDDGARGAGASRGRCFSARSSTTSCTTRAIRPFS